MKLDNPKSFSVQWWLDRISEAQLKCETHLLKRPDKNFGIGIKQDKHAKIYRHYENVIAFCEKRIVIKFAQRET